MKIVVMIFSVFVCCIPAYTSAGSDGRLSEYHREPVMHDSDTYKKKFSQLLSRIKHHAPSVSEVLVVSSDAAELIGRSFMLKGGHLLLLGGSPLMPLAIGAGLLSTSTLLSYLNKHYDLDTVNVASPELDATPAEVK